MVTVDKAVIAKITKNGKEFEILVDPELALDFRRGKLQSVEKILAVDEVYKDAKTGDRVSDADVEAAFGTSDIFKVAEEILKKGDIQLTTDQRKKMVEEKRTQIAHLISRQAIDPKSKLPHPPQRVLNAMDQARVNVDPFKSPEEQMDEIVKKIETVIPLSFDLVELAIKIPVEHAGRAASSIRKLAKLKKEEWKADAYFALIEIPAGMKGDVLSKLNDLASGTVEAKEVGK